MGLLVSIGHVTTTRTRVPYVVATIGNHLWLGQVGNRGHPFSGIGSIRTRTKHGFALLVLMLEPQGYDKGSSGAILKPGKDAIVSFFTIFHQEFRKNNGVAFETLMVLAVAHVFG